MTRRRRQIVASPLAVAAAIGAFGVGIGVGAALLAALNDGAAVAREITVTSTEAVGAPDRRSISRIYARVAPGVVEVEVTRGSTAGEPRSRAQGSGFVFDRRGHIVTNLHVIAGADEIEVGFPSGAEYDATIVATDPPTDLAVIQVGAPASLLHPLELANSSRVAIGDEVLAFGSPFGLEGTVTHGIVSALHRRMAGGNGFMIHDTIQTDAAINHGNSGGPLVDGHGRVIGVNAQIESDSGGSDGVGFAIPSSTVLRVVRQLIEHGAVRRGYLGIELAAVPGGVAITSVEAGSPAARAGLRPADGTETVSGVERPTGGDVVVAFDGRRIASVGALRSAVVETKPGTRVSLEILRAGKRRIVRVTLATRPSVRPRPAVTT
jgi:S1-C subfamily serine protease